MQVLVQRKGKKMIRDLMNITSEEIGISAENCIKDNTLIMYLQNNGHKARDIDCKDIDAWITEDIDD